jgi:preprotein translocase subunit SecG
MYNDITLLDYVCYSKHLLFQNRRLQVSEAPDPSVIIWENLMYSRSSRVKRRLVTTFFAFLFIILSLIMIFASKYLSENAQNNGSKTTTICPDTWNSETTFEKQQYIEEHSSYLHCYCDEYSTFEQAKDHLCRRYLGKNVSAQVLLYFASFMILTVNYTMEKLLKIFTKYEKHASNDGMGNSFFLRLFLLKYINSGAIFLINNNNIILRSLFGIQLSSSPEFTANWYQTVGVTIVLVQLGDIINCHSDSLWKYYLFAKKKSLAVNFPEKHLTQDELNQAMIGAKFDMAFKYAQMLSTTFVSLTFASGIPLLYPITAANFLVFYWLEKYFFISMYQIPPHFDTTVGKRVIMFIPVALCIHLGMSIWMLSNPHLFANLENGGVTDDDNYYGSGLPSTSDPNEFQSEIRKRIVKKATLPLLVMFAFVIFMFFCILFFRYIERLWNRVSDFLFFFFFL